MTLRVLYALVGGAPARLCVPIGDSLYESFR